MGKKSRTKGKTGEREFINLIRGFFPSTEITRNLNQTRNGGHDIDGLDGWAVEVKRQENLSIGRWWGQAVKQAAEINARPALAYRQNREPWKILVEMDLNALKPPLSSSNWIGSSIGVFSQ